jgi:hypothetical protein
MATRESLTLDRRNPLRGRMGRLRLVALRSYCPADLSWPCASVRFPQNSFGWQLFFRGLYLPLTFAAWQDTGARRDGSTRGRHRPVNAARKKGRHHAWH